ncbi:related to severin kinase [Cephalotrichum gorgonifer]|uniref:non-specific serine/threonine protein kinase n=1 Tax=Cephalotrichum gorgonifer TaxID=2041049 RepID=A0AAE8SZF5_9PEZI|nr:related to severin kinase [Cephalotrichum gorgonifer]
MATLQLAPLDFSSTKHKAVQDAQRVQLSIEAECTSSGRTPPPYTLKELIGKGTFGRVYKATDKSGQAVAVKIISIEEGDILDPSRSDTFRDILKEVNTLKLLTTRGAKNVNVVIDALLFGQTMWMVTELCAGGSVATLMRPTGGLPEKWIVPILREVAVAIYWVHKEGIIHRDIKCANILVTEAGQVQLCDFGVAGVIQSRFDKRSTVTGTLQWMAPELFDSDVSYGTEVDIWAFGSLTYEVATGLPPNATTAIDPSQFGTYLKQNVPRLEGDQYSAQLRDLVSYCMINDPKKRPPIELIQIHPYIYGTEDTYPTASLSKLVSAYRLWESQGGNRLSLFAAGGAQGHLDEMGPKTDEEWDFNAADDTTQPTLDASETQALYDVYGSIIDLPPQSQPPQPLPRRRRKPPPNLRAFKAPLEKVFDPYTIANYHEHVKAFYKREVRSPSSDLPLRDDTQQQPKLRESLIDLDASLKRISQKAAPQLEGLDTIRPAGKPLPIDKKADKGDKADANRRTQDWTFPVMSPLSPEFDHSRFISEEKDISKGRDYGLGEATPRKPNASLSPGSRENRLSELSLIDLDASLTPVTGELPRPSTADSDGGSVSSDPTKTPFEFETHASIANLASNREPSIYVSVQSSSLTPASNSSETSAGLPKSQKSGNNLWFDKSLPPDPPRPGELRMPPVPNPPSARALEGLGSKDELKADLRRMIASMNSHLRFAGEVLEELPIGMREGDLSGGSLSGSG